MTYRISLRSSSLWEPRHPLLKVFFHCFGFGVPPREKGPALFWGSVVSITFSGMCLSRHTRLPSDQTHDKRMAWKVEEWGRVAGP